MHASNKDIMARLQMDILPLQGFRPPASDRAASMGLGPVEAAFPTGHFPTGAVHEWMSDTAEQSAATQGFLSALLGKLLLQGGACIWIGTARTLFPSALAAFGVAAERLIFIDLRREKDILWAMEEALQCEGLAAVVGECRDIDLTASRRLQLAVEHSRVTGLLLRHQPRHKNAVASVARWKVSPLPSVIEDGLPGVGFPRWEVQLLKVRNGRPGKWQVEWSAGQFHILAPVMPASLHEPQRKTG
ncbi:Error-prone repair protein ImuA [Flavitalea sp. BT771]|uniref:ImuA family protein n=1 Tax=Flavitalea sp. BT771 TaxID=3063329 RepID=UPI0026E2BDEC|nr:Error-prone repair protein ImuA [Flavitalea sp. BT771]MDO6430343.1 Error-prone repair protein ImuA [Flavitalea sp. BT771]MDV6219517.1 Error-prone repair protein ImuA [Flavitalea sp. BT771]